jgi:hypothetical protein
VIIDLREILEGSSLAANHLVSHFLPAGSHLFTGWSRGCDAGDLLREPACNGSGMRVVQGSRPLGSSTIQDAVGDRVMSGTLRFLTAREENLRRSCSGEKRHLATAAERISRS